MKLSTIADERYTKVPGVGYVYDTPLEIDESLRDVSEKAKVDLRSGVFSAMQFHKLLPVLEAEHNLGALTPEEYVVYLEHLRKANPEKLARMIEEDKAEVLDAAYHADFQHSGTLIIAPRPKLCVYKKEDEYLFDKTKGRAIQTETQDLNRLLTGNALGLRAITTPTYIPRSTYAVLGMTNGPKREFDFEAEDEGDIYQIIKVMRTVAYVSKDLVLRPVIR